jgi:hypothetical protein
MFFLVNNPGIANGSPHFYDVRQWYCYAQPQCKQNFRQVGAVCERLSAADSAIMAD